MIEFLGIILLLCAIEIVVCDGRPHKAFQPMLVGTLLTILTLLLRK